MSRLIDADALIKEFETFIEINKKAGGVVTDKDTVRLINDAPTIDAVSREVFEKIQSEYEDLILQHPDWKPIVRCKDCKYYNPPHIRHKDGTRTDYPEEIVTADIGTNIDGMCIGHKTYCINHDRENDNDYEEIVIFRSPSDFCSYGEKK